MELQSSTLETLLIMSEILRRRTEVSRSLQVFQHGHLDFSFLLLDVFRPSGCVFSILKEAQRDNGGPIPTITNNIVVHRLSLSMASV